MSDRLLVSTRKGLFALVPGRDGWEVAQHWFLGDNVSLTHVDRRDGSWYAALSLGHFGVKLQRSTDRGASWQEVGVPAYAPGEVVEMGDGKPAQPASLQLVWSLESGGADQSGRLWAGTIPGGLFRSDDHGANWELVRGLWDLPQRKQWFGGGYDFPGIHSICVDPRDSRWLRVGVSTGGVWASLDDGASWEIASHGMRAAYMPPESQSDPIVQDVHHMVQCAGAPDTLWVQHHNGVFRSTDGARSWQEVTNVMPSTFGFAVAVHPRDPDTAWFVPAVKDECRVPVDGRLVAARTRDGGASFEVLGEGLPQQHAYDLVYRHGLAIDASGDRLAFGTTTGGLWTSDDQGERWQAAAARLPPIHAVCFSAD